MTHTLKPDAQGHINIDNKGGMYTPGDTIYITGNPKDVLITALSGAEGQPIKISNVPGEVLNIGDSTWSGGSYSYGLMFKNCHHIEVFGSSKNNFIITGSKSTAKDANGYWIAGAYFNCRIDDMSDNFKVHDMTIRYGGNGIWCKTEVYSTNSSTWAPNACANFEFYNLDIGFTHTEGMYIGHTATWWNIKTNQPYYSGTPTDLNTYKQPSKLSNVIIRNNYVHDCEFDGIQCAAIDGLQVYGNEVVNWGIGKNSGHNGGILIGGRVKGFNVHDNYVHDGWGDMIQVYAEGGAPGKITNNLLVNNQASTDASGISLRGTNDLVVELSNNTVVSTGSSTIRVNGYYGQKSKQVISNNILAQPRYIAAIGARNYIYEENGGVFIDVGNQKFQTLADAKLDSKFIPVAGTTAAGFGYKLPQQPETPAPQPEELKLSINIPAINITGLKVGTQTAKMALPDGKTIDITIVVEK